MFTSFIYGHEKKNDSLGEISRCAVYYIIWNRGNNTEYRIVFYISVVTIGNTHLRSPIQDCIPVMCFQNLCPYQFKVIEQIYGGILQLKSIVIRDNKTLTTIMFVFIGSQENP